MENRSVVYLSLGSNLGNRIEMLKSACLGIAQKIGDISKSSQVYETSPWGITNQPNFLNQIIEIYTALSPQECLERCLEIERSLGRNRNNGKWQARSIDIDILFYNQVEMDTPKLKLPHPYLHQRKFILTPLAEIAAEFNHPAFNQTISQLLSLLDSNEKVSLYNPS